MRDITFSGKGFVNKPANPESVIFTKENMKNLEPSKSSEIINLEKKTISETIGVFSNQANLKETNMSEETEVITTETEVVAMNDCSEAQASVTSLQEKTTELETQLVEAQATIEALAATQAELATLKSDLEAASEVIAAYKKKDEEMVKREKKMKRMAALVDNGIDSEVAEATVEKFDSLDDVSFEAMTSLLAAKKVKEDKKPMVDEKEEKKEEASQEVDSSVLENVEVEQEIDLSVGGDATTEIENTRAALVDFVYNRLGKKLNKGE